MTTNIPIETVSVKVMRSYDYCHFEVVLGTTLKNQIDSLGVADELRKCAARLADKAVEQYKVAKRNAELATQDEQILENMLRREKELQETPEGQRSPSDKAVLKTLEDRRHFERRRYDYEDEWEEEPEFEPDDTPF